MTSSTILEAHIEAKSFTQYIINNPQINIINIIPDV